MDFTVSKVVSLRVNNPGMTLKAIGDKCKVSKQRVHRILQKEGLPTRSVPTVMVNCAECTQPIKIYRSDNKRFAKHFCNNECKGKYIGKNNKVGGEQNDDEV